MLGGGGDFIYFIYFQLSSLSYVLAGANFLLFVRTSLHGHPVYFFFEIHNATANNA